MNPEQRASISTRLRCLRPGIRSVNALPDDLASALVEDPTLAREFEAIRHSEDEIHGFPFQTNPPPAWVCEMEARMTRALGPLGRLARFLRQPAGLAVVASIALIAAYLTMETWLDSPHYAGSEKVVELIAGLGLLDGSGFEEVETSAGKLEDWFFLTHGLENFRVPPPFDTRRTVGCRVQRTNGGTVAQVILENGVVLQMFRAVDFSVDGKANTDWQIHTRGGWAGAFKQFGEIGFIVAFEGSGSDLSAFLLESESQSP